MNTTFKEVGQEAGLKGVKLEMYVRYMLIRWADEEEIQCKTGYAGEWADRFKSGQEFRASDSEGQRVLREIYRGK